MDIRKFFGPTNGTAKKSNQNQTEAKKPVKETIGSSKKPKEKSNKKDPVSQKKKTDKGSSPSSKKLTLGKNLSNSEEDSVVIEDLSGDETEDVIKSSIEKKYGKTYSKTKNDKQTNGSSGTKTKEKSLKKQSKQSHVGNGDSATLDIEEVFDIESVPSSGSSSSKSKSDKQTSESRTKSSKSDKTQTSDKPKPQKTPSRSSPRKGKSNSEQDKVKDKVETEEEPIRSSPRKEKSSAVEKKKSRKRALSEDEDEDSKDAKGYAFNSSDSEPEEVISSRRNRNGKVKGKVAKKASRALDSDSEEDPLPAPIKQKSKKKKKEAVVVADSDEEEKKMTAMDKFVSANAKTPSSSAKKSVPADKEEKAKQTPVSVADFFGAGSASRSSRTTAVAKRKLDDSQTEENDAQASVDLTFDEEMHDDEDFMKTLDQLDGPNVKKMKHSDSSPTETSTENNNNKGSLANKLAGKMRDAAKETSEKVEFDKAKDKKTISSPSKLSPTKSPSKAEKVTKTSVKKGKVYTMEVTSTAPPTVIVSPGQTKKQESVSPAKPPAKPSAEASAEKPKDAEDDDGFGGPKGIKGYRAFRSREGPQALGSKEIPEGAENCLEGLTFVITGVLDSIDRDDAKTLVERHGGKVTGNVSGRTSYVVIGREPGESKIKKATQLKVKQIDEDGLFDLIKTLPGKTSKYEVQAKEQMKKEASMKAEKAKEEEKKAEAAKKLESFRSEKDLKKSPSKTASTTSSSPQKAQKSLFTQIKNTAESSSSSSSSTKPMNTTSLPSPASTAKLLSQSQSPSQKGLDPIDSGSKVKDEADVGGEQQTLLWVDKHKPTSLKQIIGQNGDKSNARKLLMWLKAWYNNIIVKGMKPSGNFFNKGDGAGCRAALLSGPPGIGKTTTATLVCQELGFTYIELNASDTRSKRSLKEVVAESLDNTTLMDFTSGQPQSSMGHSHCLIMDEVDGMAGNEDRGGLQELVQLIKKSKIPIICICNDRNSMKMRTLANYCLDLRFQRPRVEQIKGAMMSLAFKEGLKIPPAALNEIILASNHDIRQVIHNMSVWSAGSKSLSFDQVKKDAQKAQKDIKLGPFDVCRKVFVSDDETRKMSINDKSDLFFNDYSFGPLFVHENYPKVIPSLAKGDHSRHLSCLARTIDSICDGDLVDKLIRREGNWNLLPSQAMYSSVIPGELMRGSFPQMTDFPQWLGKFSSTNKTHRIIQELSTHMGLEVSCDKRGLNLDYLPSFRACLTQPLVKQGSDGVPDVIKVMDDYDIIKEDFDNILEITKWPGGFDPMAKLDSKTKAAFTRQYNKEIHMTPYATGATGGKKRKARGAPMEDESALYLEEGEGEDGSKVTPQSDEEEEEGIEANSMIKAKKAAGSKGKAGGGGGKGGQAGGGGGKGGQAGGGKGGQDTSKGKGKGKGSKNK